MSQALAWLPDGHTFEGYLSALPRMYPAVRFSYRQIGNGERAEIRSRIAKAANPTEGEKVCARAIAKHVLAWDVRDAEGETVAIEADNVMRLQPILFARLFNVVMGVQPCDRDPNASDEENDENAVTEEDSAKN
jgi:predicted butyrate kinase (DUF1464 family)